jgi:hypothetical protein
VARTDARRQNKSLGQNLSSLRPDDFKRKSLDGIGDDWPIGYEDVAPYFDRVDRLIGIYGSKEGIRNEPDGIFHPPPAPALLRAADQESERQAQDHVHSRAAIRDHATAEWTRRVSLLRPVRSRLRNAIELLQSRRADRASTCHGKADARDECDGSRSDRWKQRSCDGRFVCRQEDRAGTASDGAGDRSRRERARVRKNPFELEELAFPNGVANSSGTVGKYITDTTGSSVSGYVPAMENHVTHNEDGAGGMHVYMPWWLNNKKLDFPRGYHIEVSGGVRAPGAGFMGGIHRYPSGGGYGKQLKDDYRRYYGATVNFEGRGEMVPNDDSYCEVDPSVVDRFGIPVLRFHWKWQDYELNQVKHMQETFRALIAEMGGQVFNPMPTKEQGYGIAAGGQIIHELGGTRMGAIRRLRYSAATARRTM